MRAGGDAVAEQVGEGAVGAGAVGAGVHANAADTAKEAAAAAGELPPPLYDCIGVVNHAGSLGAGHYTAYCKNPYDGKWRHFNDSLVTEVDKRDIVTTKAYLLFYMRQDLRRESMAPGFDYRMATPKELEKRLALRKKLKGSGGRCVIS